MSFGRRNSGQFRSRGEDEPLSYTNRQSTEDNARAADKRSKDFWRGHLHPYRNYGSVTGCERCGLISDTGFPHEEKRRFE